ncbi:protein of unknown function [Tenacibaculum sp. MAR_2009_124]|uniref:DUF4252 domain-containing protein n=1 Tax=Tenacibaculum sp. MAR_2009_124 TaxID=1250059 RepID=UPI000896D214|nr:DUF4252 domain-containing protein [Tenacibaculum sp. MAR_2009_124]SEC88067.1 protein of unknown function [Tenacibaculum sp. MAR_2009_124]
MKKLYILSLICLTAFIVSCSKKESLQNYLVESQDKSSFVTLDVPASVVELAEDNLSEEDKVIYKSVKKVNITALPAKNADEGTYEEEKAKLKKILSDPSYKKLMSFKKDGNNIRIYYTGESDAINEIIAFGYGKELGVGVARILGEKMNPSKIISVLKNADLNLDSNGMNLNKIKTILNEKK